MRLNGWQDRCFSEVAYRVADVAEPGSVVAVTPYIALENINQQNLHLNSVSRADQAGSGKIRFESGDVLFGKLRPYFRKVVHPRFAGVCSTDIWVLRPRQGVDQSFLFYTAASQRFVEHATRGSTGTKMPRADWKQVSQLSIPLPPLPEQREIASILGALDDKIDLNRRMNATLEAMARALFQSWFVDFDPVRAKAEGRQPVGMDAETAALFPDSFEESALGPIPKGWEVATAGSVATCVGGTTPSTATESFWESGTHHWATPKDLARLKTTFLTKTERMITKAGLSQISSGELPPGTVLLSSRAPIGYLSITAIPTSINQGFIAIICNGALTSYYMLNWCRENMGKIESRASGTTFQEINKKNFKSLEVLVPNPAVNMQHSEIMERVYAKILSNTLEIDRLIELRESLLPKLLSGELRVGDVAA